ncbi:MAG: hypothetical protein WCL10_02720 [Novosphingobium sp.]|uniref:metal-dependent hydrolase n=1 Tax=Novosphingobium sp. TaxID=1874826 RepID=UPI0030159A57
MYAGHFATALALKAARPSVPTWTVLLGSGLLDVAFGALVIAGVEGGAPDYAQSHRLLIPWSHSLLGAVVLAGLYALALRKRAPGAGPVLFAAVLSHWLLDLAVHPADMQLWPGDARAYGFVRLFGPVSGWFETALVLAALGYYAWRARHSAAFGRHWAGACTVVAALWMLGLAA